MCTVADPLIRGGPALAMSASIRPVLAGARHYTRRQVMMNTTVFVFHPSLEGSSRVNKKLSDAARQIGLDVRDMYMIYPDFRIDIKREQEVLTHTDRIVLQFPMYWYSTPALLKQWEDDVLEYGWAYGSTGTALRGKELIVAVSLGGSGDDYVRNNGKNYTVTDLLRPLQATSNLIGTKYIRPFITAGALGMDDGEIARKAQEYVEYITRGQLEALGTYE